MLASWFKLVTTLGLLIAVDYTESMKFVIESMCFGYMEATDEMFLNRERNDKSGKWDHTSCHGYWMTMPIPVALKKLVRTKLAEFPEKGQGLATREAGQTIENKSPVNYLKYLFKQITSNKRQKTKNMRRAVDSRTWVEVGPGAYKSELLEYPPDKLSQDLKKLIALKKAMEERTKDLNKE